MKISELNIEELNNLFNLLTTFNDYVGRQMRLNETFKTAYDKWHAIHKKLQDKLNLVYKEINKRIENIVE